MYLLGINNIWKAKDEIVMKLMTDDEFSMDLALAKLNSLKRFKRWEDKVQRYNGIGTKYGEDISIKVKKLKKCYDFKVPIIWE